MGNNSSGSSKCNVPTIGVDGIKKKVRCFDCYLKRNDKQKELWEKMKISKSKEDKEDFLDLKMTDDEKEKELDNFILTQVAWYYARDGFHRILQLRFECNFCHDCHYVQMDKTTEGKKIRYGYTYYKAPEWWHWYKKPSYSYSFKTILKYFTNSENYYHWAKNNCKDFAHSIWDKIEGKERTTAFY